LQFAALSLWNNRDEANRQLRRSDYEAMGGVAGALTQHADEVLLGLSVAELGVTRSLFLRLVTPERTRRAVAQSDLLDGLASEAASVLRRLTQSRLIAVQASREAEGSAAVYELAHEALISSWPKLARWIDENREQLNFIAEISQAAELWNRRSRRPDELWKGTALDEARLRLARFSVPVPSVVREFIERGHQPSDGHRRASTREPSTRLLRELQSGWSTIGIVWP